MFFFTQFGYQLWFKDLEVVQHYQRTCAINDGRLGIDARLGFEANEVCCEMGFRVS
jgi:hypothetical protein